MAMLQAQAASAPTQRLKPAPAKGLSQLKEKRNVPQKAGGPVRSMIIQDSPSERQSTAFMV